MRELPILMSGPLVRATLAGQKTQTRRPIKRENKPTPGFKWAECLCREIDPIDMPCAACAARFPGLAAAGDRLWVRETWDWRDWQSMANRKVRIAYAADGAQVDTIAPCDWNPVVYNAARWHPSIHMPRWASRITLPLASVRVERAQDISEADAWAEGYEEHWQRRVKEAGADGPLGRPDARGWFAMLWDKLYGTWGKNPWVVVYEWGQIEVNRWAT
mgnify:CR=1 FL=1